MITNFKIFELKFNAQKGDYVIMISWSTNKDAAHFINNNIGKIDRIIGPDISIKYDPKSLKQNNLHFINNRIILSASQIKYHSKSKEDLEYQLTLKKFNL